MLRPLSFWLAVHLAYGLATTALAQGRMYAEPELAGANPFVPSEVRDIQLAVAVGGYSVVALRDQRQWLAGEPQYQLVFDGQIYWFAGPRDRDIFAASPNQYTPVLGGDCIVTYVDTGKRTLGKLELGLTHAGRIYFFVGEHERQQFLANPNSYANGDLANDGKCVVSQVDKDRVIVGMPETVAIVNGLRYFFAGAYERRMFGANPAHYGVERVLARAPEDQPVRTAGPARAAPSASNAQNPETSAKRLPGRELEEPEEQHFAMEGYCPVSIQSQGVWVRGGYQNHVDYEGSRYLMAGEKEKRLFMETPERFVPALAGDCIVTKADEEKRTPGSVYHSLIYEGKLYLFAGPDQVKAFKADPTKYVRPDAPDDTPPEEEATPEVEPESEGNVLRAGRRSEISRRGLSR